MKKKAITLGSIIVLSIISILSVFANFYEPIDCSLEGTFHIDLNETASDFQQPIHLDKYGGVTYMITSTISKDKDSILFHINKLSGLANINIDKAYLKDNTLSFNLSYSFINKSGQEKEVGVKIPNSEEPCNTFTTIAKYKSFFSSKYNEKDSKCKLITQGGRICNVACYKKQ